jgi:hypothetical protein
MLIRLIYASTARDRIDLEEITRILARSQANNQRRDLTGVLVFNSKIFLQELEGPRDTINALYAKLLADSRHHTVVMLKYEEVSSRRWSNWSMGFAASHADNQAIYLKYSMQKVFNPYAMSGDAVQGMLEELTSSTITMAVPDDAALPTTAVDSMASASQAAG